MVIHMKMIGKMNNLEGEGIMYFNNSDLYERDLKNGKEK